MAGTILIGDRTGLATNSQDFYSLVEAIRIAWKVNDSETLAQIYSPLDEGGMNFISLEQCSNPEFVVFQQVVEELVDGIDVQDPLKHLWDELSSLLKSDVRSNCK